MPTGRTARSSRRGCDRPGTADSLLSPAASVRLRRHRAGGFRGPRARLDTETKWRGPYRRRQALARPVVDPGCGHLAGESRGHSLGCAEPGCDDPGRRRDGDRAGRRARPLDRLRGVRRAVVSAAAARETGMAVTRLHHRGPGSVNFERMVVPLDAAGGTATTSARFREPGTYDVRAGRRHRY